MIWKRVLLGWMTLLALVFASLGATARADISPKTHVGAIDLVVAICIEAHGLASAEGQRGNWDAATTGTSDVPDAARGARGFGSFFKGGRTAKASELSADALRKGFTAQKATAGPLKFVDGNGVVRLTIKQGSSRAPGSGFAHAEFRNAAGQRVDAFGNAVTRKSPGNHTPIDFDLLP